MSDDAVKEDALVLRAQVEILMQGRDVWQPLSRWDLGCDPILVKLLKDRAVDGWPADVPPCEGEEPLAWCSPSAFEGIYEVMSDMDEAESLIPYCLLSSLDCLVDAQEDASEEEGGIVDVRLLWWLERDEPGESEG